MKYYLGYGRIPQNLDFDSLINNLDGNVTYKRKIKEGIIYFLSLLSNLDEMLAVSFSSKSLFKCHCPSL